MYIQCIILECVSECLSKGGCEEGREGGGGGKEGGREGGREGICEYVCVYHVDDDNRIVLQPLSVEQLPREGVEDYVNTEEFQQKGDRDYVNAYVEDYINASYIDVRDVYYVCMNEDMVYIIIVLMLYD